MHARHDRAAGVLVGLAAGDALGAGYEFGPAFDGPVEMKGGGPFGWEPGEWTDDTQMAICIAEQASTGDLDLGLVGDRFIAWAGEANDIGNQTRAVLSRAIDGSDLPEAAATHLLQRPSHSAGNGSLMRTGPVALPFLGDRDRIAEAAREVSALTHADPLAIDACVLWSLAVAEAVETGEVPGMHNGLGYLPADRRDHWGGIIDDAERQSPNVFTPNGFVVTALQAAWSSIVHTPIPEDQPARHLQATLENAVRIGNDTDTVAAIAGTLLGAIWGSSAVPLEWKAAMHGWPGRTTTRDLARIALLSLNGGSGDSIGWPQEADLLPQYERNYPQQPLAVSLPDDPGVLIGNVAGTVVADADVVVSLCRMGSNPVGSAHFDVRLLDEANPAANPHLDFILDDTARFISTLRDAGKTVFVHCVRAESRTPTVAAAYLAHRIGISGSDALARIRIVLPTADPNPGFLVALDRIDPYNVGDMLPDEENE
ncbi:MAG: ADP-ribosylglycohydrolase family protein [Actinomycetia bacterium]|nr:ADP-ribosylglycohydrolase family protein [Actinomycetes bacterium]